MRPTSVAIRASSSGDVLMAHDRPRGRTAACARTRASAARSAWALRCVACTVAVVAAGACASGPGPASPGSGATDAPAPTPATAPATGSTTAPEPASAAAAASAPAAMGWTGVLSESAFAALHELRDDAGPAPRGERIRLPSGAAAYLALPEGATAPLPAVLVIHEWWGLNRHIERWTDRLAADGYAALAVDLYGGKVATSPDEAMAQMKAVDPAVAAATLAEAHAFLASDARVRATKRGVIGWCFGGGWSLMHAIATPDLDAAVIYYGRLVDDPAKLAAIRAPLLGVFGDRDQGIPPAAVTAFEWDLRDAGKTIELHRYPADHGFANPSSARYDAAAAEAAWGHVRRFLAAHLRPR